MDATIENLDGAEVLLVRLIELVHELAQHIRGSDGTLVDKAFLDENATEYIETLSQIHDKLSQEIPNLVKYIPFERSSYGARKDNEIAQQKLAFAKDFLNKTIN